MKKRILSTMLMAAIMLSMAGCNGSTETPEITTEGAEVTTTTAAEKEDTAETTTTTAPETEETTTTTEAPAELPEIKSYSLFENSCLAFSAEDKNYVLNIADNKMYEYENDDLGKLIAIRGKIAEFEDNILLNFETGEIIASKEANGIEKLNISNHWFEDIDYIPVIKTEESFEGNVYSFGVLNENGEWALPLSSDYEICKKPDLFSLNCYCDKGSIIAFESYYYDFKNDKLIEVSELDGADRALAFSGDNLLIVDSDNCVTSKYNTITGEISLVSDANATRATKRPGGYLLDSGESTLVLDEDFNVYDYDLSEYMNPLCVSISDERMAFTAANSNYDTYIIILNKDGSYAVDPIKGETKKMIYLYGDYAVCDNIRCYDESSKSTIFTDYIINCATGEIKSYPEDEYNIIGVDSVTGKMLVLSQGAIAFADVSAPDTLINPFEIAE